MFKIFFTFLIASSLLYSFDNVADVSQFKNLNSNYIDPATYLSKELISKMKKKERIPNKKQALKMIMKKYKGNEFLSKNEALILVDKVYASLLQAKQGHNFLLYFFSSTVPKKSVTRFLLGVSILQDNGFDIETKQYFVGPPKHFDTFLLNWNKGVEKMPFSYANKVQKNFHLKFDSRFFKMYKVNKAPAIALARCLTAIPDPDTCKISYLIRGDVKLPYFFKKISEIDKKYLDYYNVLKANKIYKPKQEVKK